mgnify:CR=1 FL=1
MDKNGTASPRPMGQKTILSIFSFAHFSEHLYSVLLVPLLPFIRDQFGLNYFQAGLLISAFSIAAGIANLPMGWLADRLGMKQILALGIAGGSLTALAIGLSAGYYQLFFLTILAGLFSGAYHPVSAAFLSGFFEPRRRGRALGIHMVGGSFGVMAAPVIGGLLAEFLGWRWAFIILAIPALPLVFILLRLRHEKGANEKNTAEAVVKPIPEKKLSMAQMLRPIALVMIITLIVQLISMGLTNLLPVFLVDERNLSPAVAAMLLGLLRGGGIIGAPIGGFICDRIGRKQGILIAIVAIGPLLLLMSLVPAGLSLFAILLLLGVATQLKQPAVQSLLVEAVPSGRQSTILGVYFFFSSEGRSIMVPLIGFFMDTIGLRQTFIILSLVAVAFSIAAIVLRKRM